MLFSEHNWARQHEGVVYLNKKEELHNKTKTKNLAFARIDDNTSNFFAVNRTELKDNPQVLEVMGKIKIG